MKSTRIDIKKLISFVRKNSPFYRNLYKSLPARVQLRDLPVLPVEDFWKANGLKDNKVLTGPMKDGVVFKSGGSTGNPKFSVFSKREWHTFNVVFGKGIAQAGVSSADRVVNLFYVGQLYGSFLFINKSLEEAPVDVLQLPVAGSTDFEETTQIISDFKANVLAGVPTTIMNLAEYIRANKKADQIIGIKKILFGGEPAYPDQRERLQEIFPGVKILSIGYASTDAGLLGYVDKTCRPGEHRVFGYDTVVEILDEDTHQPMTEVKKEGLVVVTNLTRTLMPIIRYPAGDKGMWLEPKNKRDRKFMLMGRSEEAARIGLIKLYVQDVRDALKNFRDRLGITDFQLIVYHRERLDGLIVRIATQKGEKFSQEDKAVVAEIHKMRPLYEEFVLDSKVHPIEVQWVENHELEVNTRTGKMRRVIDKRLNP